MGLDSSAISLMLRGRREMRLNEAAQLAALIGVPAAEVLSNAGVRMNGSTPAVPIVAILDQTGEVVYGDSAVLGTVPRPPGDLPADLCAMQCKTANSDLDYMDRWVLFFQDIKAGVSPEAIERLSLIKPRSAVPTLGQVRRGYTRGRWDVSSPIGVKQSLDLEYAMPILLIIP